jgi:hypothetical protein
MFYDVPVQSELWVGERATRRASSTFRVFRYQFLDLRFLSLQIETNGLGGWGRKTLTNFTSVVEKWWSEKHSTI